MSDIDWNSAVEAFDPNNADVCRSETETYLVYVTIHRNPSDYVPDASIARFDDAEIEDLRRVESEFNAWQEKLCKLANIPFEPVELLYYD